MATVCKLRLTICPSSDKCIIFLILSTNWLWDFRCRIVLVASLVCILQSFNLCTCRVSHSSLYVCCTLTSICGPRLYVMAVMAMMFCSWKVTSNRLIVLASMTSVWFLYRTNCNGSSVSLFKFCFSTTLFNWVLSSFTPQLITHTLSLKASCAHLAAPLVVFCTCGQTEETSASCLFFAIAVFTAPTLPHIGRVWCHSAVCWLMCLSSTISSFPALLPTLKDHRLWNF